MATILIRRARMPLALQDPAPTALAIQDGRIVAVGQEQELSSFLRPGVQVIDLENRLLIPGFNDAHMHILLYGMDLLRADVSPAAGVQNAQDVLRILRAWYNRNHTSEWLLGNGYNHARMSDQRALSRFDLDAAFPEQPVFIEHATRHAALVNTEALRRAGVCQHTPAPPGGEIARDGSGVPTGLLLENAVELVTRVMPLPTISQMTVAIKAACAALVRNGVTAASDMKTGWFDAQREFMAYRLAAEQGAAVRMTLSPHARDFGNPADVPDFARFCRDWGAADIGPAGVRIGPVKLFADGAISIRTAAFEMPYADVPSRGTLLYEPSELNAWVGECHRRGWQIAVHAIGDQAAEMVVAAFATASACYPRLQPRHRMEHAMSLSPGLIRRMADLGVVAIVQPEFISCFGDTYRQALGEERATRLMPVVSLQRAGVALAFSSDCPVVAGHPLDGIHAAVERRTISGVVLGGEEACSPLTALRHYTEGAAYSSFDEDIIGRISPGMRADLVVLTGEINGSVIPTRVAATLVNGVPVYGNLESRVEGRSRRFAETAPPPSRTLCNDTVRPLSLAMRRRRRTKPSAIAK